LSRSTLKKEERKESNECLTYEERKGTIKYITQCLLTVGFSFNVGLIVGEKFLCINEVETILLATMPLLFKISTIEYTNKHVYWLTETSSSSDNT